MFAKVWIPRWAPFIAAAVLALISLEAWAPPGRAPYRPPSKPTYRPPPSRPIEPVEAQIYKVPPARKVPDFKADWSKLYRPSLTAQRHNLPGSDARAFWTSATNSLGKATTEIGSAFVLVRIFDDHVNLTTNFTQEGYSDAPVLSLKHADIANAEAMQRAIKELTGGIEPTETTQLKIVLDKDPNSSEFSSLFNKEDQTFRINTGKFTRAELFLENRSLVFAVEVIDRPKPPPRWAAKLNTCCVKTGIPPDLDGWSRLGEIPFNRRGAQLLSLFTDTQTTELLTGFDRRKHVLDPADIRGDVLESIRSLITKGDSSSPVIVVGHTEQSAFRVEGTKGFTVPFEALTEIAKAANRPIFFIGCYTARHFETMAGNQTIKDYQAYPPVGTLNSLHPREIAPKVIKAMAESTSMRDFTEKLSDENLDIWVSNNFLRNANDGTAKTVRAPIYQRMADGQKSIVGFIFMYIPCGLFGACK